ncbi:hypothetical protein PBI_SCTP2_9 [Salicola phage SCTP-2]|nr:hypothetical protein PBI_SCTP2_9 [Salicola phage SCTP-2]
MNDFDPNAISDIENALSIMQQAESQEQINNNPSIGENDQSYSYDPEKSMNYHKDMGQILDNFEKALSNISEEDNDSVAQQIKDTKYNYNEESLSIGDFKIIKNEDKTYDLFDEDGRKLITQSLLYETVYNIASYLYQGHSFNSSKVLNILKLNEKYEKFVTDARMNKRNYNKYKKTGDFDKQDIEKAKFDENKTRALSFKRPIIESYRNFKK